MKKLKLLFLITLILASVLAVSCKSTPAANTVNSLDLLDNESGFYIAVPTQADPELLKRIIQNNVQDISEKDINTVISHINKTYVGLNRTKRATEYQAALDSNIPLKFVPKVLTKKKGWTKNSYTASNNSAYDIYNNQEVTLSFPSSRNVCLGRGIEEMLNVYSELVLEPSDSHMLPDEVYNYLNGAETEIRFYADKPQSFLTILTGTNLNLQLKEVWGEFQQDPEQENQYILSLDFEFKNEKYLRAGKALLTLAFGLTAKESTNSKTELSITGIQINKESLYKLLVL